MCTDMTPTSARGSQTGLRPSSSLRSLSSLLLGDPELPPFTVEPSMGLIVPGTNQIFHIRFSPLEVAHYEARVVCRSANQTQLLVLNSFLTLYGSEEVLHTTMLTMGLIYQFFSKVCFLLEDCMTKPTKINQMSFGVTKQFGNTNFLHLGIHMLITHFMQSVFLTQLICI